MYTLGGIFDNNDQKINQIKHLEFVKNDKEYITIDVPLLTYCEKSYLDSHIKEVKELIKSSERKIPVGVDKRSEKIEAEINKKLPFELSYKELKAYVEKYYKYFPQYYEGIV